MLARLPGVLPAGVRLDALQSLVDLPVTFLAAADQEKPLSMTGCNQWPVWKGLETQARDHVVVENRHQPTSIHARTYVDANYKLTVYWNQPYGELFDLKSDPGEVNNLWNDPAASELKAQLMRKLADAMLGNEPLWMPRVYAA
jgi:arylsulfatase A-like enzyme